MVKKLTAILLSLYLLFSLTACNNGTTVSTSTLPTLKVHFIDVGQGDSILIDLGETEVLIDGGDVNTKAVDYLVNSHVVDGNIELVIVSHPDEDHIGGLPPVFGNFTIEEVWLNDDAPAELLSLVAQEQATITKPTRGMSLQIGPLTFQILNPKTTPYKNDKNNNSIVVQLNYGQTAFLFVGDAEIATENNLRKKNPELLHDIDILKVGHHGSDSSSSKEFLEILNPEVAVIMVGENNSYEHPSCITIESLKEVGAAIFRTDICGTIIITTDGVEYSINPTTCPDGICFN
jgi:competence protein ComEC